MPVPNTDSFLDMASRLKSRWQLPNACFVLDGKHIRVTKPKHTGTLYYNYKKYFSIILMAGCDADYMFVFVDVGAYGFQSDGGVLNNSELGRRLKTNNLGIPPPHNLPYGGPMIPHYAIGDEAFPLHENIMRPYPGLNLTPQQTHFNYRISRARMTIEISFGILTSRWRILRKNIDMMPKNAEKVVLGCLILHNFMRNHSPTDDTHRIRNRVRENDLDGLTINRSNRSGTGPLTNRDHLRDHLFLNNSY